MQTQDFVPLIQNYIMYKEIQKSFKMVIFQRTKKKNRDKYINEKRKNMLSCKDD